jgi:hypothetical protein
VPGNDADETRIRELEARIRLLESIVSAIRPDALPDDVTEPQPQPKRPVLRVIRGGLAAFAGVLIVTLGRLRSGLLAHPAAYVSAAGGTAALAGLTIWATFAPLTSPHATPPAAGRAPAPAATRPSHHHAAGRTGASGPAPASPTPSAAGLAAQSRPSPSPARPGTSPSPAPSSTQPAPSPSPAPTPSPTPTCVYVLGIKVCV